MIEYKIRIDLKGPRTVDTKVELTSGDVLAYRLRFFFYDDGKPYDISSCNLIIKGKRSDSTVIADRGVAEKDGTAYYDISGSMCALAGALSLELALTNDIGAYLTTKELLLFVNEGHGDGELSEEDVTPLLTQMTTLINQTEVVKNDCVDVAKNCAAEEANRVQAEAERNAAMDVVMANAEAASRSAGEAVTEAECAKNEAAAAVLEATYASLAAQKAQIAAEATGYATLAVSTGAAGKEHAIDDSARQPIVGLRLLGESLQDGVPTPDAPIEVMSVENPVVTFSDGTNEQKVTLDGITLRGLKDASGAWAARDEIVVDVKAGTVKFIKNVHEVDVTVKNIYPNNNHFVQTEKCVPFFCLPVYNRNFISNQQDSLCSSLPFSVGAISESGSHDKGEFYWLHTDKAYYSYSYVSLKASRLDMTSVGAAVASANTFLKSIGAKLYYVIKPVETDITNTEVGQALLSLYTYCPDTAVACDADCVVTYIADTTKVFNKLVTRVAQLEAATVNNI
ncbi:MAG: hypothetical protein IKW06_02215 [Clostridia bacterium]|nr:hypothetical protein [Clostridia bacterium]